MLDGNRVADDQTPEGLGLEDGDVSQVYICCVNEIERVLVLIELFICNLFSLNTC